MRQQSCCLECGKRIEDSRDNYCCECAPPVQCRKCGADLKGSAAGQNPADDDAVCESCRKQAAKEHVARLERIWMGEIRNDDAYYFPSPGQRFYGATWSTIRKSIQGRLLKIITGGEMGALVGPVGTGKTWACWATIFGVVAKNPRFHVRLIDWSDLCVLAAECEVFGERGSDALQQFERLASCRLLVIDEFGTSKPRENQFHRIYGLINRRHSQCRATLVTTTMSLGELEENMGEATVSRFRGGGIIEFNGRDRRVEAEV